MGRDKSAPDNQLFVSPREYFHEMVNEAFESRKLNTFPLAKGYLVDLLQFYVPAENLFDDVDNAGRRTRETLAETFLKAQNAEPAARVELLKRLADRSLYISGFFSDSLQRKLVDVDYYADMGCTAYGSLAETVREDTLSRLYREFSSRFLDFVDVLTHISSRAAVHNEENILRLYETFSRTGSDLAREKLIEKGLIAVPIQTHKKQQ